MRRYLPIALLLATALSFWLVQHFVARDEPDGSGPRVPDYYLQGMVRSTRDDQGRLRHVLRADRLEHFDDDDSIDLVRPRLELYNDDGGIWFVQSETGWVSQDAEIVMLYGPVEIHRQNARGENRVEVVTSDLRILPDDQYAETENHATIRTPQSTTTAIGMQASLERNRLRLMKQVKSHYEKPD